MIALVRLADRSLHVKIAVLLIVASLLPLGLAASRDLSASRRQLIAATEALLSARADELAREIDTFHRGFQSSTERLARLPTVTAFSQADGIRQPASSDAKSVLDVWRASDPRIRGAALLDRSGVVRLGTDPELMGADLSFHPFVRKAIGGQSVISDVFLETHSAEGIPTIGYLEPIRDHAGTVMGAAVVWIRASALRDFLRASNGAVAGGGFSALLDGQGIRIAHSFNDTVVFHPAGPVGPAELDALIGERRFGGGTRDLLLDVRAFPELFSRAVSARPDAGMFRGYGPANRQWSYGVARRLTTVLWTIFYLVPDNAVDARLSDLLRTKLLFGAAILLSELLVGLLFAGVIVNPLLALADATQSVAAGDLTVRVPNMKRADELGRLGRNFNVMVNRIEGQATALKESRDDLDRRVRDRTDELLRTQARLAALSESGIIGIIIGTLDGHVIEINDALLEMVGYSRDEIVSGRVPWRSLTPAEWRDGDDHALDDLRAKGVMALREKEYVHKNGTRVPVLLGSTVLTGRKEEAISFVLDLTHNKRAAIAVEHLRQARASEAQFRSLLEAAPDAVVIVAADGTIKLVNGQAERLFSYGRGDLLGQSVEMLLPARLRDYHPCLRSGYFADPGVRPMGGRRELFGRRSDGTEVPVEVSLSPLQTEEGLLVTAAIRDISERKKVDEQRFRLAAIVDSSGDAIIGKTLEGIITSWNEAAHRIFGYLPQEIVGQSITVLIPPDRQNEEKEILAKLAKGERIEQFDTVRLRKDGREIPVSLTSSPVRDSNGSLIGASKIVRDITERRRAEIALAEAKDRAEAASRELEAFSYSVAHDLRAPLRGMNGFAHVLLEGYRDKLDAEGQDWLQEIVVNAKKMGELIDGLLSLARVTRSEVVAERVNLSAIAAEVVDRLKTSEPGRQVEVAIQPDLVAEVDSRLAHALLENLIGNAWKFSGKVSQARLEFGGNEKDGEGTFFVRDNGAGFDPTFANKLFAPFQRLHTTTEFAGTGIGLATAQRIVHRHGGRIWAQGAVGEGASFSFTLPSRIGRL